MTDEERLAKWFKMEPKDYPNKRVCPHCDLTFDKNSLAEHADHLATHNPSPAQWKLAHERIEAGKAKAKSPQTL